MTTDLWNHQRAALAWLEGRHAALLHHDPGVGKSRVVVEYVARHRPARTLIVAPLPVVPVWPGEFGKHGDGRTRILQLDSGSVSDRADDLRNFDARAQLPVAIVINYESAWREPIAETLLSFPWDLVVLDESQRAKSPGGKASRFLARLRARAAVRLCLSGTPFPHSPLDAYAQFRFLEPSVFGTSVTSYRARYAVMGGHSVNGRPVQIVGWRNMEEWSAKVGALSHRVRREDVLDLPPFQHVDRDVVLPPAAMRAYKAMERDLIAEIEAGTVTSANAMVKVTRLAQLASGHAKIEETGAVVPLHAAKAEALAELLDEIDPLEPIAVFTRFVPSAEAALRVAVAAGRHVGRVDGKENTLGGHVWKPAPGEVLVCNYASGSLGLDFTAARYCVLYEATFNGGEYEQSLLRVHRANQVRGVVYWHLLAKGTQDRRVRDALARKKDAVEAALAGLGAKENVNG
ncbi:MAG TPA: DEAD/DEAH box helicase [Planctomycetota bacterium]|nr:DEAD/DEAH box helicase [Planctomycetota bacterium]